MSGNQLRIGQFITQYPYEDQYAGDQTYFCSGAERVAQALSEGLVELDCDVTVCTSSATWNYSTENQSDITVDRSPSLFSINTTQIAPTQIIDPLSKNYGFDVVHAHNSTPPGVIAGWLYAQIHDVPFVITHHGGENYEAHGSFTRRAGLSLYTNFLITQLFGATDVAVSPTEGYIQESRALSAADRVDVIPNGIDLNRYSVDGSPDEIKRKIGIDPDAFLVLYIGSLHPRKGADVLLEGFVGFHERYPDAHLVIGGGGTLKDDLEQSVDSYGVTDAVTIPGFIPESNKPTYMAAADVFVLPSVTPGAEVSPLVLLEAAAAETSLIASQFDTIESIIGPTDSGILVTPGSEEDLSTELERLYENTDMRHEMASNAYQMARNQDWSSIAEQYRNLYEDLL